MSAARLLTLSCKNDVKPGAGGNGGGNGDGNGGGGGEEETPATPPENLASLGKISEVTEIGWYSAIENTTDLYATAIEGGAKAKGNSSTAGVMYYVLGTEQDESYKVSTKVNFNSGSNMWDVISLPNVSMDGENEKENVFAKFSLASDTKGNFKASGIWKVYGSTRRAESLFRKYSDCARRCTEQYLSGIPIERICSLAR